MSRLELPAVVAANLRDAVVCLGKAHAAASEVEGPRWGLNGRIRDMIFALNSGVDSLADMIEDGHFTVDPAAVLLSLHLSGLDDDTD